MLVLTSRTFSSKGTSPTNSKPQYALNEDTYFELASISKTFTATLAAALGAQYQSGWKTQLIENYTAAMLSGGLQIGSQFNNIPLSTLLSYTSGLPADNNTVTDLPPDLPVPYSPAEMLGYLNMTNLTPSGTGSCLCLLKSRFRYHGTNRAALQFRTSGLR